MGGDPLFVVGLSQALGIVLNVWVFRLGLRVSPTVCAVEIERLVIGKQKCTFGLEGFRAFKVLRVLL